MLITTALTTINVAVAMEMQTSTTKSHNWGKVTLYPTDTTIVVTVSKTHGPLTLSTKVTKNKRSGQCKTEAYIITAYGPKETTYTSAKAVPEIVTFLKEKIKEFERSDACSFMPN